MGRILAAMLLGLVVGCAAWAVSDRGGPDATDAKRVFTARWQAVRLGQRAAMPMDQCGACLELCRDAGDDYSACAARCAEACGLGSASAWAEAE